MSEFKYLLKILNPGIFFLSHKQWLEKRARPRRVPSRLFKSAGSKWNRCNVNSTTSSRRKCFNAEDVKNRLNPSKVNSVTETNSDCKISFEQKASEDSIALRKSKSLINTSLDMKSVDHELKSVSCDNISVKKMFSH